ncbi:MAG TPA: DUF2339 domain-containing protein [Phycisphaerales bacterium]|nr:DUF2339 domain-containing protein [Phycisphaerales bacterium]
MDTDPDDSNRRPDDADSHNLATRVAALEARVAALESSSRTVEPSGPSAPGPAELKAASQPTPRPAPPSPPPSPARSVRPTPPPAVARTAKPAIERQIGGRVFAAVGALAVIVGLALGVKVALDEGWFRLLPPIGRCLATAAFGAALLVVGEIARRRINALAAAGLNAAGVGALYVAAYAAYGFFGLIDSPPVAFALMAVVSAVGIAVAIRGNLASTAVLSLLGGYLIPILLADREPAPLVLPLHLLALAAVALSLSAWRRTPFAILRPLSWWATGILGTLWTAVQGADHAIIALGFWAAAWWLYQVELVLSARRHGISPEETPRRRRLRRAHPIVISLASSAWATLMATLIIREWGTLADWMAPAAGFVATAMASLTLGSSVRVLRERPRTDTESLAACFAVQAGGLLMVTVTLALAGWTETAAWLAMGVAAVVAGRWIAAPALDRYGLLLLGVATGRLLIWDHTFGGLSTPWVADRIVAVSPWMVLVLIGSAAWAASARLVLTVVRAVEDGEDAAPIAPPTRRTILAQPGPARRLGVFCAAVAAMLWLVAFLHVQTHAGAACIAWLVGAAMVFATHRVEPRLALRWIGAAMLGVALARLLVFETIQPDLRSSGIDALGLRLTPWSALLVAGGVLASLMGRAAWAGRSAAGSSAGVWALRVGAWAGVCAVLASAVAQESSAAALAVFWSVGAVALSLVHRRAPLLRLDAAAALAALSAAIAWLWGFQPQAWHADTSAPLLHPGLWRSFVVVAALVASARALRSRIVLAALAAAWIAAAVALTSTTLEIARVAESIAADPTARRAAVSIWWGLAGAAAVAGGFLVRRAPPRYAGLALIALAMLKVALLDLQGVPPVWRVASFLGLGLLMLGVAVLYARLAASLGTASDGANPTADGSEEH